MYFNNVPEADLREQYGDLDHFRRLVNFANFEEKDWVWDPDDVTDAEAHEYGIYLVGRIRSLERVAGSFREFVEQKLRQFKDDGSGRFEVPILPARSTRRRRRSRPRAETAPTHDNVVRLVVPPERWGERNRNLLWSEITESGDAEPMIWMPETKEEVAEARRFWEACQAIDWDAPGIHEVRWVGSSPGTPRKSGGGRRKSRSRAALDRSEDRWQALYDSIEIAECSDPVPKPRVASLDAYERKAGFKLPQGYREFLRVFGPGEFGCGHSIGSPGYPGHSGESLDLTRLNLGFWANHSEEDWAVAKFWDDMDRVRRMVLFGTTEWADYLGWDPQDVTDPARHEYGIYRLPHSRHEVERLAGSFWEFVGDYCLGEGFLRDAIDWDAEEYPIRVFRPACR
jgi:hypothetical protein